MFVLEYLALISKQNNSNKETLRYSRLQWGVPTGRHDLEATSPPTSAKRDDSGRKAVSQRLTRPAVGRPRAVDLRDSCGRITAALSAGSGHAGARRVALGLTAGLGSRSRTAHGFRLGHLAADERSPKRSQRSSDQLLAPA